MEEPKMENEKKFWLDRLSAKKFVILLVATGLVAGFVNLFPHLLMKEGIERQGNLYMPIQADIMPDEAIWYVPMSKKIYEYRGLANDFFFKKYEKTPTPIPLFPNFIYAILFFFTQDVTRVYLTGIFVFSFILFFLFYLSGKIFLENRAPALLFAALATVASTPIRNFSIISKSMLDSAITFFMSGRIDSFWSNISYFFSTFDEFVFPISSAVPMNRELIQLTDPFLTYLIYIPAIACLMYFFIKSSRKTAVIAGMLVGMLFLTYLFYAVLLSLVAFLYLLFAFIRKYEKKTQYEILILNAVIFFFFLIYALSLSGFYHLPQAREISRRLGMEHGFDFRWLVWKEYVVYAAFFALNWLVFRKSQFKKYLFYSFAFVSMFFCYNLQMLFGFMPHPDHWARTFSPLLFIFFVDMIFGLVLMSETLSRKRIADLAAIILVVLMIVTSIFNFFRFKDAAGSDKATGPFEFDKKIYSSYEWVNEHPGDYISPSFLTTYNLILYTKASPFMASAANSLASNYELEQRFLETLKIWNVSPSRLEAVLTAPEGKNTPINKDMSFNLYTNFYQDQSFNYSLVSRPDRNIPPEHIKDLLIRYENLEIDLARFKGYYMYYGPFEREIFGNFSPSDDLPMEQVFSNEKVVIYRII